MHSPNSALRLIKAAQYKLRRNVGLDDAENTEYFSTFQNRVEKTIMVQVKRVMQDDKVLDGIIFLINKAEADANAVSYLSQTWVGFEETITALFGAEVLDEFYIWAGEQGGQAVLDRMGLEATFQLTNDAVTQFLMEQKNLLIDSVDTTTKEQLVRVIQEGREGLLTVSEIKELIDERFKDISRNRAELIARTELANAFNAVEYETLRQNGAQKVRWVTVMDERVCPICEPLHNQEKQINGNFDSASFNGLRPPAHVNCRCFLEEVLSDFKPIGNRIVWTGA